MSAYDNELNRFDQAKLDAYRKIAPQLAEGSFPYPRQVTFYPTYRCNHRCPGCLYHIPEVSGPGEMGWADFGVVRDTLQRIGVERIEVSGGGEPACHPQFGRMLAALARITPQLGVISNGSAFSRKDMQALLDHAAYLRISLDSLDPDTYRRMHGPQANLHIALSNLEALKSGKTQYGARLTIGVKFLITTDNAGELEQMLTWGQTSGLDHIQFKSIRQASSEPDPPTAVRLDAILQAAKRANTSPTAIYGSLLPIPNSKSCWTSPLYTVIDPYGDVYICCYYYNRQEELRIGNLLAEPFEDLWGSERHRQKLSGIRMQNCVHDCRFKMYNALLRRH